MTVLVAIEILVKGIQRSTATYMTLVHHNKEHDCVPVLKGKSVDDTTETWDSSAPSQSHTRQSAVVPSDH